MIDDIFSKPPSTYKLSDFRLTRMVLSPKHWQACKLPVKLAWHRVKFAYGNAVHVPENERGVYTFVVKPGIASHPSCSYLLYVGKVENQMFRSRFRQYLAEKAKGAKSRRPHVTEMLLKWDGFLWFYYAAISKKNKIKTVENRLLAAYLPPSNRVFPSTVRHAVATLLAH